MKMKKALCMLLCVCTFICLIGCSCSNKNDDVSYVTKDFILAHTTLSADDLEGFDFDEFVAKYYITEESFDKMTVQNLVKWHRETLGLDVPEDKPEAPEATITVRLTNGDEVQEYLIDVSEAIEMLEKMRDKDPEELTEEEIALLRAIDDNVNQTIFDSNMKTLDDWIAEQNNAQ